MYYDEKCDYEGEMLPLKCDKLKEIELGEAYKVFDDDKEFYLKSEADDAIAELKEAWRSEHEACEVLKQKLEDVNELIKTTRQMLEDTKATLYADSVDAGMRERRLRRALWLARAEMAKHIATFCYYALHYGRVPVREIYQCQDKWDEVERMCLKKAEEY